jgi:hypothetical protein
MHPRVGGAPCLAACIGDDDAATLRIGGDPGEHHIGQPALARQLAPSVGVQHPCLFRFAIDREEVAVCGKACAFDRSGPATAGGTKLAVDPVGDEQADTR